VKKIYTEDERNNCEVFIIVFGGKAKTTRKSNLVEKKFQIWAGEM
jgi:hypothetical protein